MPLSPAHATPDTLLPEPDANVNNADKLNLDPNELFLVPLVNVIFGILIYSPPLLLADCGAIQLNCNAEPVKKLCDTVSNVASAADNVVSDIDESAAIVFL